jgi:hypothetical protein
VRLPSWLHPGCSVFHASNSESELISLASQSLREKIVFLQVSEADDAGASAAGASAPRRAGLHG